MLDLVRKKMVKMEKIDSDIKLVALEEASPDTYEQDVLTFIRDLPNGGEGNGAVIKDLIKHASKDNTAKDLALKLQKKIIALINYSDPDLIAGSLTNGRNILRYPIILSCLMILISLLLGSVYSYHDIDAGSYHSCSRSHTKRHWNIIFSGYGIDWTGTLAFHGFTDV